MPQSKGTKVSSQGNELGENHITTDPTQNSCLNCPNLLPRVWTWAEIKKLVWGMRNFLKSKRVNPAYLYFNKTRRIKV